MQHSIKDLGQELADEPVETLVLPEETLGSLLQRARLAKRLQIDDVAIRLRFKPGVIQAMEDNNFPSLGAPVFARMYLLRYTQLLGLPEHDILARYKALGIDEPPPLRVNPSIKPQARTSDLRWLGLSADVSCAGLVNLDRLATAVHRSLLQKLGWAEEPALDTTTQNADTAGSSAMTDTAANLNAVGAELISPMIATDNPVFDFTPNTLDSTTLNTDQTVAPGDAEEPALSVAAIWRKK
ncbi:MAG: helix-turn-helix domain-containing protein [Gammaproteobacteria bacterium]